METFDVNINEENEISFKFQVKGASGAIVARLYCENGNRTLHAFPGDVDGEQLTFKIPEMSGLISEGVYPGWIEIAVGGRQFVPAKFRVAFYKVSAIQAENVSVPRADEEIIVSARPIVRRVAR